MYRSSVWFRRTPAQRADQMLSWNRDDVRFFAAGACHILAFAFLQVYPGTGFQAVGVWARGAADPMHVYVTDGVWAFDFEGWTPADELMAVTRATEPDAGYEQRPIGTDLSGFCGEHNHRDRPYFAFDPWQRCAMLLVNSSGALVAGRGVAGGCGLVLRGSRLGWGECHVDAADAMAGGSRADRAGRAEGVPEGKPGDPVA